MNVARALSGLSLLRRLRRGEPVIASFNFTDRCNEACPMCVVWRGRREELALADVERVLDGLAAAGVRAVEISGGEPFLRRELPELMDALDRRGLVYTLTTNATVLPAWTEERLRRARGLLQVAVSLDTLDRARYARLRGRDLFPQALAGLERLRGAGLAAPVKVNFTLSRENHAEALPMLEFVRARGLLLSVFPVNQGPGLHRSDEAGLRPSGAEREAMAGVFEALARLRRRGAPLWEYSGFYRLAARYVRGQAMPPCDAGRLYVDVRADGGLAPCVERPAAADLRRVSVAEGLVALGAAEVQRGIADCHRDAPCCYTCTMSLSQTARHPVAYAAETAHVLARRWLARRGLAAAPAAPPEAAPAVAPAAAVPAAASEADGRA